jgi:DNA-binding GntR family transcriptional regulator
MNILPAAWDIAARHIQSRGYFAASKKFSPDLYSWPGVTGPCGSASLASSKVSSSCTGMTQDIMGPVSASKPISRRSLHDELVGRLRELIGTGALAPGEKIQEMVLCKRFAVSRTPLREALKVLASEGIVTLQPHRGATVASLSVSELEEVFPVMGALESLAGEIACSRITDQEISEIISLHRKMVEHWRRRELQPYFKINQAIHAILQASHNETLKSLYRALAGRLMTARYVANMSDDRWHEAVVEHEMMLSALQARDGPELAAILKRHLANKFWTVKAWLMGHPRK